jgi:DnaK suppressor protein
MNKQLQEEFKKQLEELKNDLERELLELEKIPELGEGYDPDIETQESEEFDKQLSMAQVLKERLMAIEEALLKLDRGTYGFCDQCGLEISLDVLQLVPESKLCKECKQKSNAQL